MRPSDIYELLVEIKDELGVESVALCVDDLPEIQLFIDNGEENYSVVIPEGVLIDLDTKMFIQECFEQYLMLIQNENIDTIH